MLRSMRATRFMRWKTIGIIGGMGPWAGLEFEQVLLGLVRTKNETEYPPIIAISDPTIPDRATAFLGKGPSPVPAIVRIAKTLVAAKASVLCMPCVTAHIFYPEILVRLPKSIKFINMVDETVRSLATRRVGLLATSATIQSNMFQRACAARDIELIVPSPKIQIDCVQAAIYKHLKTNNIRTAETLLRRAMKDLMNHGAKTVILGCTELSIALKSAPLPLVNVNEVLARAVLREAR